MRKIAITILFFSYLLVSKEEYSPIIQNSIDLVEQQEGMDLRDHPRYKPLKRWLHIWSDRIQNDEVPNTAELFEIIQSERKKYKKNKLLTADNVWNPAGPSTPPSGRGIGRINRLRFHPNDENIIFAATAGGGVWKTTNQGDSWNILPTSDFLSMCYSDIVISESNPNIIYLATGDANAAYLNGDFYSIGILKSTDGGKSFNLTNLTYELSDGTLTPSILIDPNDPNFVIAGTSEGIYITKDGGQTWEQKNNEPIKDLEFLPNDKNVVLATTYSFQGGASILRSTDKGENWTNVQNYGQAIRVELATSESFDNYVAAVVVETRPYNFLAFAISEDGGQSFQIRSDKSNSPNITGRNGNYPSGEGRNVDQAWYNLSISIYPTNKDEIYVGGIDNWVSTDGGRNWSDLGLNIHVDQHYHLISGSGKYIYFANDGGLYQFDRETLQYDIKSNGMEISQFYKCDASKDLQYFIGGTQDNSTFAKRNSDDFWWRNLSGDGMDCHIDPFDSDIWYGSSQYGRFRRSINAGANWDFMMDDDIAEFLSEREQEGDWVTPMAVDPVNSNNIYIGYYDVFKNDNYGEFDAWEVTSDFGTTRPLEFIEVSEKNPNYILAGFSNALFISKDEAKSWINISVPTGNVSNVTFHPENEEIFYATISNFREGSKVYKFVDGVWENYSGNLPKVPINVIKVQKDSPERLYVGTDIGVYYTDYGSKYWERYGVGMPYTIVNDLEIDDNNDHLLAATYGRGMWETDLIYCNENTFEIENLTDLTFCEGNTVILKVKDPMPQAEYIWSNGEIGTEIEVAKSGIFSAATLGAGCQMKSNPIVTEMITVNDFEITALENIVCPGDSISINATFGLSNYVWNDGETSFIRYVKESGTYSVQATQNNGCVVEASIEIFESTPGIPEINRDFNTLSIDDNYESYQWYLNDTKIPDATNSKLELLIDGDYRVEVENSDGCLMSTQDQTFDVLSVKYQSNKLEIIPNPNDGHFVIKSGDLQGKRFNIVISNINGEEFYRLDNVLLNDMGNKIDIDNLSSGIYFVKLQGEEETYVEKIIVE